METEIQMIDRYQKRQDMHFLRWLKKVDLKGEIGQEGGELCLIEGLIEICPPRPEINNPYTCYRLTKKGKEEVERIEKKYAEKVNG